MPPETPHPVSMAPGSKSGADERPNILFIMTDQQFAGAMSCVANPHVRTPAMDAIAASGVRFDLAYTSNPICVPARTTLFTARMGHDTGVDFNTDDVVPRGTCFAKDLRDAGYDTGYFGKWHVNRPLEGGHWSGFDTVALHREKGADPRLARPVAEFIGRKRRGPFFAVASFMNPHNICEYARRLSGMEQVLPDGELPSAPGDAVLPPLPANFEIPDGEPSAIREHQAFPGMAGAYPVGDFDERTWRRYRWGYFRMIEMVDREIGKVLDALKASGQWDRTLVVFTSDHGDGMGAHRWNQKTLFYEEVARVPFMLSHPGVLPQGVVDGETLVSPGLDLAPTLFSAAGLSHPPHFTGTDLWSLATCKTAERPEFIVAQTQLTLKYGVRGPATGRMVRSARYKYIVYNHGNPREQLFDLATDPGEMKNLATSTHVLHELERHREMLRTWALKQGDPFPAEQPST